MFEIKTLKLSQLKWNSWQIPWVPKNPRIIKDDKFKKLKGSIEQNPEMLDLREPIAVDYNNEYIVICGNMRLKAMKDLWYTESKVKVLRWDTTPENIRAYIIKDNVAFGSDDWDSLANEWDIKELDDWGVELTELTPTDETISDEEKKSVIELRVVLTNTQELDTLATELKDRWYNVKK
jgi:ParB-like chromosome segregation protein Spo0J